jgi:hypothetical protein
MRAESVGGQFGAKTGELMLTVRLEFLARIMVVEEPYVESSVGGNATSLNRLHDSFRVYARGVVVMACLGERPEGDITGRGVLRNGMIKQECRPTMMIRQG